MGKQFYSGEETLDKLGMTDDELMALVRDGQLREFHDASEDKDGPLYYGKVYYKVEEVQLVLETTSNSGVIEKI